MIPYPQPTRTGRIPLSEIIKEEIKKAENLISIETPGFVETYDMQEVPLFMATKRTPSGLEVIFLGEDDYLLAPSPETPFYVSTFTLYKNHVENIKRNIVDFGYDIWFELWFDLTDGRNTTPKIRWYKTMQEARYEAERIYRNI